MKRIGKMISILLAGSVLLTACAQNNEKYNNYSYGLNENGVYETFDVSKVTVPELDYFKATDDEILTWTIKEKDTEDSDVFKSVDSYLYTYGQELLATLGVADKEVAEDKDIVSATMTFKYNDKVLENYGSKSSYKADKNGDAITKSFIGHKAKDEYDVKYTFPEDDPDYAGKEADVHIVIDSIIMADPLTDEVIKNNLDKINEILPDVVDKDSFLKAIKPKLAETIYPEYIAYKLQNVDVAYEDTYVDAEMYRLKFRLAQMGYSYNKYLEDTKMTDEEVKAYCAMVAKENMICMKIADEQNIKITEDDVKEYHGENFEYLQESQGLPYLKLNLMRDKAIAYIIEQLNTQ